ncbi:hypothetical protein [Hydrogenivirga sp. 128-5-R1-1]|uniref:hypothetical protein n=1 Tax=Hydrogenivirga sp. 128-5-R1-1 TaxID=392423 RepID=UPI00015F3716|nr:hypothetical protein [Hydrogenivirga sp. 128-5-R1-1]EDP76554.1 hypothetical protein HG1285_03068 [Hydrogenivirga sp. 128-5-R1-1]
MRWKEELKRILDIPEDAEIVTRPYYREIPKRSGRKYRALTVQYMHRGKKRYRHVSKEKEALINNLLNNEDTILEYVSSKVRELKDFLDSIPDEKVKDNLKPLYREIDRLLTKVSVGIL